MYASKSQLAFAQFQYYQYLNDSEILHATANGLEKPSPYTERSSFDETQVRQRDGKLSYLKSQMDRNPTKGNVYALVDEINDRKVIERIFRSVFAKQSEKENDGEKLVSQPKDFACMRTVHRYLDEECDNLMSHEFSLSFNRYVVDYCETTKQDEHSLIDGVIHEVCGV